MRRRRVAVSVLGQPPRRQGRPRMVDELDFSVLFFFFQAEDGIRDIGVTGVHVCSSDLERFLPAQHLETLLIERQGSVLLDRLAAHEPRLRDKWLDRRNADQEVPNTRSPASPKPGLM